MDGLGLPGVDEPAPLVHVGHVGVRLGEVIMVLLKEVDKVLAKVWLQMSSNMNLVVRQVVINGNFFEFLQGKLVQSM